MAYIQVEASVRTHAKFLKAGPAASWLWLCGMGYCQDGLTDGFIPFQALDYIGIKASTAKKLKTILVEVGLWEVAPGGWQVHDYLTHNRSAEEIKTTKDRRRAGGILGGRPTKETLPETLKVSREVNHSENPPPNISTPNTSTHLLKKEISPEPPSDSTPVVMTFQTVGSIRNWALTQARVEAWKESYPALDVSAECLKARAWLDANVDRRKTAKGMPVFIVNWLNRASDRSGPRAVAATGTTGRGRTGGPPAGKYDGLEEQD
jgi:hypothetical protein